MSAQRPTPVQLRVLRAVECGEVTVAYGHWREAGGGLRCDVAYLFDAGLIRLREVGAASRAELTDAGRAALDAARGTAA